MFLALTCFAIFFISFVICSTTFVFNSSCFSIAVSITNGSFMSPFSLFFVIFSGFFKAFFNALYLI